MKLTEAGIRNIVDAAIIEQGPMRPSAAAALIVVSLYRRLPIQRRAEVVRDLQDWEIKHGRTNGVDHGPAHAE